MPGIFELYRKAALDYIHRGAEEPGKISRCKFERTLLSELEKASFPIDMKMVWYDTVLTSELFDDMWVKTRSKYFLPLINIARYYPDPSLCEYSVKDSFDEDYNPSSNNSPCTGHTSVASFDSSPDEYGGDTLNDDDDDNDDDDNDDDEYSNNNSGPKEVWWGKEGQEEMEKQRAAAASLSSDKDKGKTSGDGSEDDKDAAQKKSKSKQASKAKAKKVKSKAKGRRKKAAKSG